MSDLRVKPVPSVGVFSIGANTYVVDALHQARALSHSVASLLSIVGDPQQEGCDMHALSMVCGLVGELVDASVQAIEAADQEAQK